MDEDRKLDLAEGIEAAQSILHRANDALAKEDRVAAVAELQSRVEDWKGHKIGHFGELLLYGSFTVLKGEGAKEVEREVRVSFIIKNVAFTLLFVVCIPSISPLYVMSQGPLDRNGTRISKSISFQIFSSVVRYQTRPELHASARLELSC